MLRHRRQILLALLSLSLFAAAPAAAVPMAASGTTQVYVSAFGTLTGDLGLSVTPLGPTEVFQPAGLPSPNLFFPITAFDATEAQIFHDGIGLSLGAGGTTVDLENFVVDADDLVVLDDVTGTSTGFTPGAPVFDVIDCAPAGCTGLDGVTGVDGLGLLLSDTAAGVLHLEFGVPGLGGTPIGVANSFLQVPEPSVALLFAGGALGLAAARRRRAA